MFFNYFVINNIGISIGLKLERFISKVMHMFWSIIEKNKFFELGELLSLNEWNLFILFFELK
jgi:hypothetical protein